MHNNAQRQIMLATLQEILPHLPTGYSIRIGGFSGFIPQRDGNSVTSFLASIHSHHILQYENIQAEVPRMTLYCQPEQFQASHVYYLPADWPYRGAGCYQIDHRYEYANPDFPDALLRLVASMADDPDTKTRCWEPRNLSPAARERRRQGMILRVRAAGHEVAQDCPFSELRRYITCL